MCGVVALVCGNAVVLVCCCVNGLWWCVAVRVCVYVLCRCVRLLCCCATVSCVCFVLGCCCVSAGAVVSTCTCVVCVVVLLC